MILRPTRPEDVAHVLAEPLPYRIRALTAEIDGRVIGVGGLAWPPGGAVIAWAALTDELRAHPLALHRAGRRVMAMARAAGLTQLVASADPAIAAAPRWLERFGFVELAGGATADGHRIFVWRGGHVE